MFGPILLTWVFYGLYLLLFSVFLNKTVDQLQFLARASVIFFIWWIFLFLFIKIENRHQLFYDRWFDIIVVDMKVIQTSTKKTAKQIHPQSDKSTVAFTKTDKNVAGIDLFLNQQQKNAVFADPSANLRVIAGPGTGKTTVLINRIIFLLQELKVAPWRILTLTFTRKACQNIKDRVAKIANLQNLTSLPVFTYHGFCYWFLTVQHGVKVNILDQTDQRQVIKSLLLQNEEFSKGSVDKELVKQVTEVVNFLQQKKLRSLEEFLAFKTTSEFLLSLDMENKQQLWHLHRRYSVYKEENQLFDFVDLLTKTQQILTNNPDILSRLRKKYLYLAVDEFQDTNELQFDLIKLLSDYGKAVKTTVVGDPDQTIYSWRGSQIDFILNFQRFFQPLNTVTLVENYRSQKNIVTLANQIIVKNKKRILKNIVAVKPANNKVVLNLHYSTFVNAAFIVFQIETLLQNSDVTANEIVVLYRVNYLSSSLERLLLEKQIPYHIYKGQEFFKRKEIKDLLTLLRIIIEPLDIYLESVLSWIKGIGPKTIANIKQQAKSRQKTIFEYLNTEIPFFLAKYQGEIQHFLNIFNELNQQLTQLKSLKIILQELFNRIYQPILVNFFDSEQRLQNVDVLIEQVIVGFETNHSHLPIIEQIREFLAQTQLSSADDLSREQTQRIKLMTIHNAKGLEFDYVFLFEVSSNNFPNLQRKQQNLEEERRLFFVAITRARKGLFITGSDYQLSPFVKETLRSAVVEKR